MKKKFSPLLFCLNIQLFAEKEEKQQQETQMTAEEYAANIKKLRETSVPKEEYDKVVADNKTLAKALAEGVDVPEHDKQENKPDIKELRKKFLKAGENNLSNVEFVQTTLELRKALMEAGEPDPFLPRGLKRKPDNTDFAGAQRVAEFLEDCLEQSKDEEGKPDPDMFNAMLKKGIANDSPLIAAKIKALKLN